MFLLIGLNVVFSLKGIKDNYFFNKYCLNVYSFWNNRDYKRLITSGFLHVDYAHLIFNMATLYFFSPIVIKSFGQFAFLVSYVLFLVLSNIYFLMFHKNNPNLSAVGASGAVSGVIFSAILLNPNNYIYLLFIPIPIPAYLFACFYILYCIFGMRTNLGNIGHSAHLGGAMAGVLITIFYKPYVLSNIYVIFMVVFIIFLILLIRKLRLF